MILTQLINSGRCCWLSLYSFQNTGPLPSSENKQKQNTKKLRSWRQSWAGNSNDAVLSVWANITTLGEVYSASISSVSNAFKSGLNLRPFVPAVETNSLPFLKWPETHLMVTSNKLSEFLSRRRNSLLSQNTTIMCAMSAGLETMSMCCWYVTNATSTAAMSTAMWS